MTALGKANALTVLAVAEKGAFLHAPDMYMEKLVVGPAARGVIDLAAPLEDNLRASASGRLGKTLSELTVSPLAKPRHEACIRSLQRLGVHVFTFPDGDVAASILTCMPDSEVDVMYGIGGAPEGVISAPVIRAMDGDMQGRLLPRHQVKGDTEENRLLGADNGDHGESGAKAGRYGTQRQRYFFRHRHYQRELAERHHA